MFLPHYRISRGHDGSRDGNNKCSKKTNGDATVKNPGKRKKTLIRERVV